MTFIGIANSVELFQGELTGFRARDGGPIICQNEQKLLFKPYTRDELAKVLNGLAGEVLAQFKLKVEEVVNPLAFLLAASKVDRISGDIRVCFEILRLSLQKKIESLKIDDKLRECVLNHNDVNGAIGAMFESKVAKIINNLPRSHLILLSVVADLVAASDEGQLTEISTT